MDTTEISPTEHQRLRSIVDRYMALCDGLDAHCSRCLATQRWGGSVALMVVDAAFMSIGLNYFTAVVPGVAVYEQQMLKGNVPDSLSQLAELRYEDVAPLWKNRRSWDMAKGVAAHLSSGSLPANATDRDALRLWAGNATTAAWRDDPVGRVKGVGINTYQYMRMMGGVDTSMPDKIVRRVIANIVEEAKVELPVDDDLQLITTIDTIGRATNHRPIELCWMTWMVQSEGKTMRMDKYRELLTRI
ncbi:MAG: hypothetical protein JW846_02165 [Dehalococcoidia bacterium]|nr:hypothetical protein [Dehalococcoidia bacterium]